MSTLLFIGLVVLAVFFLYLVIRYGLIIAVLSVIFDGDWGSGGSSSGGGSSGGDSGFGGGDSGGGGASSDF